MNLRASLTRNWPLKLTSLTLAVVLWVMAAAEEPATTTLPVRIAVQAPEGRTLLHPPGEINAIISGPRGDLFRVASEELVIIRTLPDTATRQVELEISPNDVDLPPGAEVRVHDVYPRRLSLELDAVGSRSVPVRPLLQLPSEETLTLAELVVEPAEARITGPAELVRRTDTLYTVPLALDGSERIERRARIDTSGLGSLRIEPAVVMIRGNLRGSTERSFGNVPVLVANGAEHGFAIPAAGVTVTVRGTAGRVAALTADSIVVTVAPASGAAAALRVIAPAGLAARVAPDSVRRVAAPAP